MMPISGKRKRQAINARLDGTQHRGRGRPLKRASDLKIARTVKNAQLRLHHEQAQHDNDLPKHSLSRFESLPNELIQQIFFFCFEVNLARASPHLANVLSSGSVYNALILFAYFDDDGVHPVEVKHFLPAEYRQVQLKEKIRLQAGILQCRWFTLDRVRACLPALSMLKMTQAWHAEHNQEAAILEDYDAPTLILPNKQLLWAAQLPELGNISSLETHFLARGVTWSTEEHVTVSKHSAETGGTYQPRIMTWTSSISERDQGRYSKTPHAGSSILAARVLPNWLVVGAPWTDTKVELLQLLRQGFQFVDQDYVLELSATAVLKGMANAIRESHVRALTTLLELHSAVFGKVRSIDHDAPSLTPSTYHRLPVGLFHLAATQKADGSALLWLLIRAGIDSVPHDDSVLTSWALEARTKAEGNRAAEWLLGHMDGTNDYHLNRGEYLFVNGRLSGPVADTETTFPPASRTFAEELDYLPNGRQDIPKNSEDRPCG